MPELERLSVITRFDKEREVTASLSGVVVIHPPAGQRVTPGLIVGVTNQRARDRTILYADVDPGRRRSAASVGRRAHRIVVAQHRRPDRRARNLAIALTPHLSIVPDVRYDYGSIGDEINNTLRTSVRLQWRF